ncbi:MAG: hypothetical protein ACYC55_09485 [Candidatus Geothermincolia bacterium]
MKIAFPHMGRAAIPLKGLVDRLGLEPVIPEKPHRHSLELGIRHAPEFVCLPFKSTLGDFIDALERGADTLAMVCGMWACRFGYYGRVQHQILRDLGYEFDSILIGKEDVGAILGKLRSSVNGRVAGRLAGALAIFSAKARAVDEWEWAVRRLRPRERVQGETDMLLEPFWKRLDETGSLSTVRDLRREAREALASVELVDNVPLKVALLGEVYMTLEPNLNLELERMLGELRVEVIPALTVYRWLLKPLHIDPRLDWSEYWARRQARPYIRYSLGGEEHWTIAGTMRAARTGLDGVIHVYPLTCMPENICRTILPRVRQKYDVALLDLCFDEHSSPVGIHTRLEAFCDLMSRRRADPGLPGR